MENNEQNHPQEKEKTSWTGERFSTRAFRFRTIVWGLILIACAVLAVVVKQPFPERALCHWGIWLVVPLFMLVFTRIHAVWKKYFIRYELKGDSLICEKGIFSKKIDTLLIQQIKEVEMVQDLVDRFINKVGTVKLTTSDVTDPVLELRGLENFDAAFNTINEQRKLFTRRCGVMSFGTSPIEEQNR